MSLGCSVIIVSWNVADLLQACLDSVKRSLELANIPFEIIVVDNDSHDHTAAMLRSAFPEVRLIETGANLGFAVGVNRGLKEAQAPWAVVLNPDTVVDMNALPLLLEWLQSHDDAVVAGPRLFYADGTVQSSCRRWPSRWTLFMESTMIERWWPSNPWAYAYHMHDVDLNNLTAHEVDWLVGAVLVVRMAIVQQVGGLDESFWMYSEELEWQQRLARYGSIWYVPAAEVIHYEGRSSAQIPARKHVAFQASKLRYALKQFGPSTATVLHMFLLTSYCFEWTVEAAKWLLGHKRSLRRERLAVYAQVVKSLWP